MEAPQSDGDTGGVSATGTPMLKSVTGTLGWANAGINGRSPCLSRAPPPTRAGYHMQGAACPGQQHRPQILPNLGTW
ncbi:hypothetical protein TIFTF001_011815 [Ficus carica]|uniref:Uncharacterized protein n=1 Tax=Ficus carica TaxID=3494 RepID=A0AA87ZYZ2_FICCA|nr:hypothetical protein TIFTF001_011815 [Ficus carica]